MGPAGAAGAAACCAAASAMAACSSAAEKTRRPSDSCTPTTPAAAEAQRSEQHWDAFAALACIRASAGRHGPHCNAPTPPCSSFSRATGASRPGVVSAATVRSPASRAGTSSPTAGRGGERAHYGWAARRRRLPRSRTGCWRRRQNPLLQHTRDSDMGLRVRQEGQPGGVLHRHRLRTVVSGHSRHKQGCLGAQRALFLSGWSFSASLRYAAGAGRCRPRGRSAHSQAGRRGATVGTAERRPPAHPPHPTPPCAAPLPTLFHVVLAGALGHPQYLVVARGGADACNQLPLLRRGLQMKEGRAAATATAAAVSMLGGQAINLQNTQVQACSARASIRGEHCHHRRHSRCLPTLWSSSAAGSCRLLLVAAAAGAWRCRRLGPLPMPDGPLPFCRPLPLLPASAAAALNLMRTCSTRA